VTLTTPIKRGGGMTGVYFALVIRHFVAYRPDEAYHAGIITGLRLAS